MEVNKKQLSYIENMFSIIMIAFIFFVICSLLGKVILYFIGLKEFSLVFGFIFFMGILATVAFLMAIIEEIRSEK